MRYQRGSIFSIAIIFLAPVCLISCGDKETTPQPSVSDISPKAGLPGVEVTITGTNFSEQSSVVKFGTTAATVVSATDTKIVVKVPDDATTGVINVTTDGGTVSTPEFKVYAVYVASKEKASGAKAIVKIWKNGKPDPISDGVDHATATGFVISGSDTYISGYNELPSGFAEPVYWKNKTIVKLPFEKSGVPTDIEVSGADIYVAGASNSKAAIWKNGSSMTIQGQDKYESRIYAMALSGADVYAVGYTCDDASLKTKAALWKNGVITYIGDVSQYSLNDVAAAGTDVYIVGEELISGKRFARSWKNGVLTALQGSEANTIAAAAVVVNGDFYVCRDSH